MIVNQKIPSLRFPEFYDKWDFRKIKEILTIGSGKDYKHLDKGNVPVFGTGGLMTMVNSFLHDGETVCIGRKGTIDKPMYFNGKIWTVDTLFYTHSYRESNPKFVFNLFQRVNWKQHNEAGGVPSLSKSTIENISLCLPTLPEQTKIASFLTAVDDKLHALKQKHALLEQYKKGVMQQLFSGELRFKDENGNDFGDWEKVVLGSISDVRDGTHDSPKYVDHGFPLITSKNLNSNGKLDFKNVEYITQLDFDKINKRSKVDIGDIIFGMIGTIGNPVLLQSDEFAIKNVALIKEKQVLKNSFLIQYLNSTLILNQFKKENIGGTQKFLSLGIIRNLEILLPSIIEQTKIASFLSAIDEKINQCQAQIAKTEVWKKGLLQQLFV